MSDKDNPFFEIIGPAPPAKEEAEAVSEELPHGAATDGGQKLPSGDFIMLDQQTLEASAASNTRLVKLVLTDEDEVDADQTQAAAHSESEPSTAELESPEATTTSAPAFETIGGTPEPTEEWVEDPFGEGTGSGAFAMVEDDIPSEEDSPTDEAAAPAAEPESSSRPGSGQFAMVEDDPLVEASLAPPAFETIGADAATVGESALENNAQEKAVERPASGTFQMLTEDVETDAHGDDAAQEKEPNDSNSGAFVMLSSETDEQVAAEEADDSSLVSQDSDDIEFASPVDEDDPSIDETELAAALAAEDEAVEPDPQVAPAFEFIGSTPPPKSERFERPDRDETVRESAPPQYTSSGTVRLDELSARAFEHPADRAALTTLRKVPGLDTILRKLIGLIGERSLRLLYLASAVRVNERQFPDIHKAYLEVCETLDIRVPPELFVAQNEVVNAGAVGVDVPFIVLHSSLLSLLEGEEIKVVLAHELGHILADHALYKTLFGLLLNLSISRFGIPLGNLALFGIVSALREWDRKSELSSDRAGLLATQNPELCYTVHMKLAGGARSDQMDLEVFAEQAEEYEKAGSAVDGIFKLLNLIGSTHPFHVTRLLELRRWVNSGAYTEILSGEYPRRLDDVETSVYDDVREGVNAYRESYETSEDPLTRFLSDVGSTVSDTASSVWSSTVSFFERLGGKGK